MNKDNMFETTSRDLNNRNGVKEESLILSKQFVDDFQTICSKVIDESLSNITYLDSSWNKGDRIKKMSEYYTFGKRPMLGELTVSAYELLENPENLNDEKRNQIYVLACAMEVGMSIFFFMDDIQDEAKTRCGKPCWHCLPDVGSLAMNDVTMLCSFIYALLQQNFPGPLCFKIMEVLNKIIFLGAFGQHIDMTLAKDKNYNNYTLENYKEMNEMKVSFFAIEAPIIVVLLLTNKATEESIQQIHYVCQDIGIVYQIQNDMMDFYNKSGSVSTKTSTDIQTGKCSWLAITALERCNDEQRRVFEKCYGSWNPIDVQNIRKLYEELQLPQLYVQEIQARYETYLKKTNELPPTAVPGKDFYHKIFNLIKTFEI